MYLSDSPSLFHCLHRLSDLRSEIYSQRLSLSILVISISYNYLQSRIYLSPTLKPVLLRQWHVWLLELTVLSHSEEVYSVSPLHTSQYAIIVKPISWPSRNRTYDILINSQVLLPTELWVNDPAEGANHFYWREGANQLPKLYINIIMEA